MKRFEVWIDCDPKVEEETRRKVKAALEKIDVSYTLMPTSTEIIKKGSPK